MVLALLEGVAAAWPLIVTLACAVALERRRLTRRRAALNRALHELRRPLQVLALMRSSGGSDRGLAEPGAGRHLEAAISALDGLDAEVNGRGPVGGRPSVLRLDALAREAVERWSAPARHRGRSLELRWRAGAATVSGDRSKLERALDNLVANALEHGRHRVRVEGTASGERVRIAVIDGGARDRGRGEIARSPATRPHASDPRRGHGLELVTETAADHRGRFALSTGEGGSTAVLELPLASAVLDADRAGAPPDAA